MPNINCVTLGGHLSRDAELRVSQSGKPWCRFNVAVNGEDNAEERGAAFINCVAFGSLAEKLRDAKKGDIVHVSGRIKTGSYEKNGVKHYTTDVVANLIHVEERKTKAPKLADEQKPSTVSSDEIPF